MPREEEGVRVAPSRRLVGGYSLTYRYSLTDKSLGLATGVRAVHSNPKRLRTELRNINKFHSEREARQCKALPSYYLPLMILCAAYYSRGTLITVQ